MWARLGARVACERGRDLGRATEGEPPPIPLATEFPTRRRESVASAPPLGADPTALPCDPLARALAAPAPMTQAAPDPPPPALSLPLDALLQRLVRRAAWGGDGRRAAARLELGAGVLDGATLTVLAEADGLVVELDLPPGEAADAWRRRIEARLAAKGLRVREVSVR